jgi:signal transduction histidine kinase
VLSQLPVSRPPRRSDPVQAFESRLLPTLIHLREQSWVLAAVTTLEPPSTVFRAAAPGELWAPIEVAGKRLLLFIRWTVGGSERDLCVAFAADAARAIAASVDAEHRAERSSTRAARAERRWASVHIELEGLRSEVDRANLRAEDFKRRIDNAESRVSSFAPITASSGMLAGIAHDVRSPLTSILCNLSAIEEELRGPSGVMAPILEDARLACERIESVVASVRPITDQATTPTVVDVHECVTSAVRLSRLSASRASVQVKSHVPAALSAFATSTDVCQVLLQLLENAIEASSRGSVVSIDAEELDDLCVVRVSDAGRGIPASEREQVFMPFRSRKVGALGVGLAVARTLMRKHGGDVRIVAPEPGMGGATLEIRLPRRPVSASAAAPSGMSARQTTDA